LVRCQRSLVAGHDGHGVEVDVSISAGQTTNIGQIRIVTTQPLVLFPLPIRRDTPVGCLGFFVTSQ